ncbi:MAG: serine/threonine protein kinase, partial [Deltaproteobacteria bacterium]|nr:serine/threonine protein kinase [Deltaproteobacteria bacterium]
MVTLCPTCSRRFEFAESVCPDDGARLMTLDDIDPLIGTVLDGRYKIERKLGAGGMGAVYVATQTSVGREVAIKVLRPEVGNDEEAIKRFGREAQNLARLQHANIVQLFDFGRAAQGLFYLAMEFARGRSLTSELAGGRLNLDRVAAILGQVCDALTEAHGQGIVHRDLKPDNILLLSQAGNADFVKVLDFGISKVMGPEKHKTALTAAGTIIGTPQYMSPEQIDGAGHIGPAADLYALAIIAFEMLTGAPPFQGDTQIQLLIRHVKETPPRLGDRLPDALVPETLERFVAKGLAKQPAQRCTDAQQFKAELKAALALAKTGLTVRGAGVVVRPGARDSSAAHAAPTMTGRMPDPALTIAAPPPVAPPTLPYAPPPRKISTAYNEAVTLPKSAVAAMQQPTVAIAPELVVAADGAADAQATVLHNLAAHANDPTPVPVEAPAKRRGIGMAVAAGAVALAFAVAAALWLRPKATPVPAA